jgi:hypothetical protein
MILPDQLALDNKRLAADSRVGSHELGILLLAFGPVLERTLG